MKGKNSKVVTKAGMVSILLLIILLFGIDIIPIAFQNTPLSNITKSIDFSIIWYLFSFIVVIVVQVVMTNYGYPPWKDKNKT